MFKKVVICIMGLVNDVLILPAFVSMLILSPFVPKLKFYLRTRLLFNKKALQNCNILIFCSSNGEFDQAIPIIEKLRENGYKPAILFHSNNGYKYARELKYSHITLAPFDSFIFYTLILNAIKPHKVIINRNELWPGFISASSLFSKVYVINFIDKRYTLLYGALMKLLLFPSTKIFTVNYPQWLNSRTVFYTGDSKIDRVKHRLISEEEKITVLQTLYRSQDRILLILGNAYENDCNILVNAIIHPAWPRNFKIIIIPARPEKAGKLNEIMSKGAKSDIIHIVPAFGNLLHYYAIGDYVWIGGGFNNGIHNVIEPMACSKNMISGPNLNQQPIAVNAYKSGALRVFSTAGELIMLLNKPASKYSSPFDDEPGPTNKILELIELHENNNTC